MKLGKSIGEFQKYLDGFPAQDLFEIIPKFHYTPNRYKNLIKAIESEKNKLKRKDRFEKAKIMIEFLTNPTRREKINIITNALETKTIPLRVTHNDTKLSNILFDKETEKAVCLIDLDTVMPGAIAYDFGEAIRTCISRTKEDEENLSKIKIEMDRFESFTKGFLNNLKNTLTKEEKQQLVLGAWMMTYENALRFLTDYLNGDIYFHVDKNISEHNLIRTASQIELLKQIEKNKNEMERLINKYGF